MSLKSCTRCVGIGMLCGAPCDHCAGSGLVIDQLRHLVDTIHRQRTRIRDLERQAEDYRRTLGAWHA